MLSAMSPFRHPTPDDDLPARIEWEVRARLEEAIDYVCLQALVQARRARNLPPPAADSRQDREEFMARVRAFLRLLLDEVPAGLGDDERPRLDLPEAGDEQARLIAAQVSLARTLPDYWQRFEVVSLRYLAELEESGSERPGLLARLFRRG
jgi:hypothetical protein